jgi:hypothetical protein
MFGFNVSKKISKSNFIPGFVFLLFFLFHHNFAQPVEQSVDIFIARNPADFEILNLYQQKVDPIIKSSFQHFMPWIIIEENALLSDQYTQTLHVEFKGKSYFFVKNDQGELINLQENNYTQIFYNCTLVNDTVSITQKKSVLFKQIPHNSKDSRFKSTYLEHNLQVNRLFKKESDYYVQVLGKSKEFGWIHILNKNGIQKKEKELSPAVILNSSVVLEQIKEKIGQVNKLYSQLFTYMNGLYAQDKEIPQWQITEKGPGLSIFLSNPALKEKLEKSTSYLLSDLQTIVKNSSFALSTNQESFEIYKID